MRNEMNKNRNFLKSTHFIGEFFLLFPSFPYVKRERERERGRNKSFSQHLLNESSKKSFICNKFRVNFPLLTKEAKRDTNARECARKNFTFK